MTDNKKLIEEALVAYWGGAMNAHVHGSVAGMRAAFAVFEKALTPTDDERAIFEAIADRLGEHSQARNFEIADSGEYETKLRGPVDVEVLAEWLLPTVLGFRRSEVPEPSAEPKHDESCAEWCNHCQACGEGIRYGSRCREHYQNQPQGEPSDALNLVIHAERVGTERDDPLILELAEALRVALRAAGVVAQEGESRG